MSLGNMFQLFLMTRAILTVARVAVQDDRSCNGSPLLCQLRVDQVTFPGVHNAGAFHLKIKGTNLGKVSSCVVDNHARSPLKELDYGLRFLDIDTCKVKGDSGVSEIRNCHGLAEGLLLSDHLQQVANWLEYTGHRNEVVVISFGGGSDANPGTDTSQESKIEMMKMIVDIVESHLGAYMAKKNDVYPISQSPTLEQLIVANKRVIVLWGPRLWYCMYLLYKDSHNRKYVDTYLQFEKAFQNTWNGDYGSWNVDQLKNYMTNYCDQPPDPNKPQSLLLVDAYLTLGTRSTICNYDLANDVNPALLSEDHPTDSPLVTMQTMCWAKQKQVSFVAMDYAEEFPEQLTSMVRSMNERNFARHVFIGGIMTVGPIASSARKMDDHQLKALLMELGDLEDAARISVDKTSLSEDGRTSVEFTIKAIAATSLRDVSNMDILSKMKESVKHGKAEAGVLSIRADCGDPGVPHQGIRRLETDSKLGYSEGAIVAFECLGGRVPHGSLQRVCGHDGLYTGIQPWCKRAASPTWSLTAWQIVLLSILACLMMCACCFCICRMPQFKKMVEKRVLMSLFDNMDTDGSQSISEAELTECFMGIDLDGDGMVDRKAWEEHVDIFLAGKYDSRYDSETGMIPSEEDSGTLSRLSREQEFD